MVLKQVEGEYITPVSYRVHVCNMFIWRNEYHMIYSHIKENQFSSGKYHFWITPYFYVLLLQSRRGNLLRQFEYFILFHIIDILCLSSWWPNVNTYIYTLWSLTVNIFEKQRKNMSHFRVFLFILSCRQNLKISL